MTSEPPFLDLLVIGGLTVDRFADGSSSPGGTVIHVAREAGPRGLEIGVVTASGEEPEAVAGLTELRRLARVVEHRTLNHSATFLHRDSADGRRLWLEHRGGSLEVDPGSQDQIFTGTILFAPVLAEIPSGALGSWDRASARGAILQGWLRSADEGSEVLPLSLTAVASEVVDALARFNLLVASREDLLAESEAPYDQLSALRRVFGRKPTMIVTDGAEGLWLDMSLGGPHRSLRRHVAVPWRVEAESTVGAGDILAAFLTARLGDLRPTEVWVEDAMRAVAEVLEERALRSGGD